MQLTCHTYHVTNNWDIPLEFIPLPPKAPRMNASEKWHLLKTSAATNCPILLANLSVETNRVDQDRSDSIGAVRSWSTLFVIEAF